MRQFIGGRKEAMTNVSKRTSIAALAAFAMAGAVQVAYAEELVPSQLLPAKGVSLTVGTVQTVAYFLPRGSHCDLTVQAAALAEGENVPQGPVTRFDASVPVGKAVRISAGAKLVEFGCKTGSRAMSVQLLPQVAWVKPE
jgi:hypothetical protein